MFFHLPREHAYCISRPLVWHQFLPWLPVSLAGSMFGGGVAERAHDGLQCVLLVELPAAPRPLINILVLGKAEGQNSEWHGHITALTVAPEYRRLSLARKMIDYLERVSDTNYRGFFVDLYVRCTNNVAIDMYEGLGYSVYRRVREYYGSLGMGRNSKDEEDAFGESSLSYKSPGITHSCG